MRESPAPAGRTFHGMRESPAPVGRTFHGMRESPAPVGRTFHGMRESPAPVGGTFHGMREWIAPVGRTFHGRRESLAPVGRTFHGSETLTGTRPRALGSKDDEGDDRSPIAGAVLGRDAKLEEVLRLRREAGDDRARLDRLGRERPAPLVGR